MDFEHVKDMVGGSENHFFTFGENYCLEDVDGLGDVGHVEAIVVLVKDVEGEGSDEGIA